MCFQQITIEKELCKSKEKIIIENNDYLNDFENDKLEILVEDIPMLINELVDLLHKGC